MRTIIFFIIITLLYAVASFLAFSGVNKDILYLVSSIFVIGSSLFCYLGIIFKTNSASKDLIKSITEQTKILGQLLISNKKIVHIVTILSESRTNNINQILDSASVLLKDIQNVLSVISNENKQESANQHLFLEKSYNLLDLIHVNFESNINKISKVFETQSEFIHQIHDIIENFANDHTKIKSHIDETILNFKKVITEQLDNLSSMISDDLDIISNKTIENINHVKSIFDSQKVFIEDLTKINKSITSNTESFKEEFGDALEKFKESLGDFLLKQSELFNKYNENSLFFKDTVDKLLSLQDEDNKLIEMIINDKNF
jgi:hypothetical protein